MFGKRKIWNGKNSKFIEKINKHSICLVKEKYEMEKIASL
jgi:hypothetical protein